MGDVLIDTQLLRTIGDTKYLRIEDRTMKADELREALEKLGLTQVAAAKRLHVSLRSVQNWVAGSHDVPGPVKVLVRTWLRHPELLEEANDG